MSLNLSEYFFTKEISITSKHFQSSNRNEGVREHTSRPRACFGARNTILGIYSKSLFFCRKVFIFPLETVVLQVYLLKAEVAI